MLGKSAWTIIANSPNW